MLEFIQLRTRTLELHFPVGTSVRPRVLALADGVFIFGAISVE